MSGKFHGKLSSGRRMPLTYATYLKKKAWLPFQVKLL